MKHASYHTYCNVCVLLPIKCHMPNYKRSISSHLTKQTKSLIVIMFSFNMCKLYTVRIPTGPVQVLHSLYNIQTFSTRLTLLTKTEWKYTPLKCITVYQIVRSYLIIFIHNNQFSGRYLEGERCKVVPASGTKAYQMSRGIAPLNLNCSIRLRLTASLKPWLIYPQYPLNGRICGP
jgi:hypothetical protein